MMMRDPRFDPRAFDVFQKGFYKFGLEILRILGTDRDESSTSGNGTKI